MVLMMMLKPRERSGVNKWLFAKSGSNYTHCGSISQGQGSADASLGTVSLPCPYLVVEWIGSVGCGNRVAKYTSGCMNTGSYNIKHVDVVGGYSLRYTFLCYLSCSANKRTVQLSIPT